MGYLSLLLSYKFSLHILDTSLLFAIIFFYSMEYLFTFLVVSFEAQVFNFNVHFIYFFLWLLVFLVSDIRNHCLSLASIGQLVGALSHNQKVASLIPGQSTYPDYGFSLQSGRIGEGNLSMFLSHWCFSLSLHPTFSLTPSLPLASSFPSSLSKSNEKMSLED